MMSSNCLSSCLLVLLAIVITTPSHASSSSRVLCNDLNFTTKVCQDYGLEDSFDVCAVLEVCSSGDQRRRLAMDEEGWWVDSTVESFADNVETAQMKQAEDTGVEEEEEEEDQDDEEEAMMAEYGEYGGGEEGQDDSEPPSPRQADLDGSSSSTTPSSSINVASFGYRLPGETTCSYPGPTMRFQQGKKHAVLVRNTASDLTNVHFHGMHMKSTGNGDNVLREISPNVEGLTVYKVDLTNHMGGTHWYHPHLDGKSWGQVKGGAFGMIVVEDDLSEVQTTADPHVADFLSQQERILILSNTEGKDQWRSNGVQSDTLQLHRDSWYRLRILMVNVDSHSSGGLLKFDSTACSHVLPIAHDGILRFQVPADDSQYEYYLTSSSRLDVAIQCSSDASIRLYDTEVAKFHIVQEQDAEYSEAGTGPSLATPYVNGDQVWNPKRPLYLQDMTEESTSTVHSFKIHVDETNINGHQWHHDGPLCPTDGAATYFTGIHEWTITGANTHPLHLHTFPMQVINDHCGSAHVKGEFYDTILTAHGGSSKCKVRINFGGKNTQDDLTGPTLLHCHIFEHAQHGAMTYLPVGPTTSNDDDDILCTAPNDCPTPSKTLQTSCSGNDRRLVRRRTTTTH